MLVSGGGRSLQNLADRIADGRLTASIDLVIASNTKADEAACERDLHGDVPIVRIRSQDFDHREDFSDVVFDRCRAAGVDLVVLAGWLSLLRIAPDFEGRVLNIHPALLPSFGGPGMYGDNVHEAVLKAGCKVSGCTVHLADDAYDNGPILVQRCCPVLDDDTSGTLAARVFEQECEALPEGIGVAWSMMLRRA
ncbi:Phosphoribosylglycinamide formyltransferase [Mucisphaera calidilacus]|uniref:phosphoribosylglycinamide formyltransferase 1 n=1 Tax=Mucisphaera calidilacus TaxID=2527982 RepID=A0A518BWK5_9BACT|nr:Phosphoribosylglycinamide formyltransferase [Mucisphaera calidilacus]